jgi:trichohyalin
MTWNRRFASPVYGISSADLNNDGLEELVITTINGVSFFLPDPRTAKRRLTLAVERMREIKEMREILEQLRRDNRKLVEDQRVKEMKEKEKEEEEEEQRRKEAEEERQRKEKEAEEERLKRVKEAEEEAAADAACKENEKLELEELERKEKEEKVLEVQQPPVQQQQEAQQEQGELEKGSSHEQDRKVSDTEEKEESLVVAVENVKEEASAEAKSQALNDDEVGTGLVVEAEPKTASVVEDEDGEKERHTTESAVGDSESKDNSETSEVLEGQSEVLEGQSEVLEGQSEVRKESLEHDSPDQGLSGPEHTDPHSLEEYKSGNASRSGSMLKQAKE